MDRLPEMVDAVVMIMGRVDRLLATLEREDVSGKVGATLGHAEKVLAGIEKANLGSRAAGAIDELHGALTKMNKVLDRLDGDEGLVASVRHASDAFGELGRNGQGTQRDLEATLRDVSDAAEAIRSLAEAIERDPDMLLKVRRRARRRNEPDYRGAKSDVPLGAWPCLVRTARTERLRAHFEGRPGEHSALQPRAREPTHGRRPHLRSTQNQCGACGAPRPCFLWVAPARAYRLPREYLRGRLRPRPALDRAPRNFRSTKARPDALQEQGFATMLRSAAPTLDVEVVSFDETRSPPNRGVRVELKFVLYEDRAVLLEHTVTIDRAVASLNGKTSMPEIVAAMAVTRSMLRRNRATRAKATLLARPAQRANPP